MDFLRDLFGFSNPDHDHPNNSKRFLGFHEEDNSNEPNGHFNVFTDPLEMHRYFEQQMDQVFRTFGFPNFGNFFPQTPAIDRSLDEDYLGEDPKNLRENFLRKDYVKPHYEEFGEKADHDLDGKVNPGDIGSLFKDTDPNKRSLDIYRDQHPFGGTFFNQSVQVKTIRKPDGSLESQKTVRDSQGNEETTITRKLGDKEYTIIKKLNKDGKEETQEIMKNIDEKDKAIFEREDNKETIGTFGDHFNNFLFNKFFK